MLYNGASELEFGSFDGGGDDDYTGVGLVEISEIFAMQNAFFFGIEQFTSTVCLKCKIRASPRLKWTEKNASIRKSMDFIYFFVSLHTVWLLFSSHLLWPL